MEELVSQTRSDRQQRKANDKSGGKKNMRRGAILSIVLSGAIILGITSPAFASEQILLNEVTAGTEASVLDSKDDAETEQTGQDDGIVNSEKESVDVQETAEEGEGGTETGPEEASIDEEAPVEDNTTAAVEEAPEDENKTESVVEEEEKPENLVGAEGERVSVGENVTAGFNSATGTLTFYSHGGTLSMDLLNKSYFYWDERDSVKMITISNDSDVLYLPADSGALFEGFNGLRSLNLSKADTANVTNMAYMFSSCDNLQTLDLRGLDTSNVTNMKGMFKNCTSLQTLNLSGFNTSNVISMTHMFFGCSNLQTLDVSGFDTSNVTNMSGMFYNCSDLQTLDVSGFDTSNVTNMQQMFDGCSSLQMLDVSGFETSNVMWANGMFRNCGNLQTLDVSGFDTSTIYSMAEMFANCGGLQALDVSGFNTSRTGSIYGMFSGCSNLQELDVSNFDVSKIWATSTITGSPSVAGCDNLFSGCSALQQLDLSSFNMDLIDTAENMISCDNLQVILTPVNLHLTVDLPGTFVDASGTEYNNLPIDLAESIRLTKKNSDSPAPESIVNATVTGITAKTYTGTAQTQNPTVKLGNKILANGTDYTLSYVNNTNAGTATVTITGKGNYTGTVSRSFTINKAAPKLTFASTVISKTTQDAAFTNALTKTTDGTVTFKSSNTSVAAVNSTSGKVTIKGAGTTTITATAAAGTNYKSGSAQYTLTVTKALKILNISDDFYGKTGTQASFHVEAEGSGTISYQWQYRTSGMGSWKAPAQGSAKTADYAFTLRPSYDNIEVRCIVSDDSGAEVISETGKANVFAFTLQPSDAVAEEGQVVKFEVSAIGRGVTYQWYYMRPNSVWNKTIVSGSKTAVLPITAGTKNDGTSYRCVITDTDGNQITSSAGILTVETPLRITAISEDAYAVNGKSVNFHIDAVGEGKLTYQWQYKIAGETKWKTPGLESAKTADYSFKMKPSYDNIEVRCIVKDVSGNEVISDTRKANVFAIIAQPADVTTSQDQNVDFKVSALGRDVTYQWYYMRPNSTWKKAIVSGSKTAVLPIAASAKNDGTSYRCVITDEVGNEITSDPGTLTLETLLQITGISEDAYDVNGKNVTFHIDAEGNGELSYQWQYRLAGETKWRTPSLASAKTADYVFKLRPSYDNIEVRCIVQDASGNSVTSDVRKANVFAIIQQPNTVFADQGEKVTFAVEGIGRNLTYQWYYRELEGDWQKVITAGYNTASLTITAQVKNNGSQYRCYVYDGVGNLIKSGAAMLIERNVEYEG